MIQHLKDSDVVINIVMLVSLAAALWLFIQGRVKEAQIVATPGMLILGFRVVSSLM